MEGGYVFVRTFGKLSFDFHLDFQDLKQTSSPQFLCACLATCFNVDIELRCLVMTLEICLNASKRKTQKTLPGSMQIQLIQL